MEQHERPGGPAVHLRGVVSLLGRFPALSGLDLDVERGEVVVVTGPNGAGKTTLLRVLAGQQAVTSGRATVLGLDLAADVRAVRRRVGLLGHATGLYDDLTVAANVEFWTRASRAAPGHAAEAMALLGLDGRLADVEVQRLSAGQRRRTALAVLVARRPELWLLDEPHASLDAEARDVLDRLIADAARAGATVLLSSHEAERVAALGARSVALVGGRASDGGGPGAA